jgi:hypothetical protein
MGTMRKFSTASSDSTCHVGPAANAVSHSPVAKAHELLERIKHVSPHATDAVVGGIGADASSEENKGFLGAIKHPLAVEKELFRLAVQRGKSAFCEDHQADSAVVFAHPHVNQRDGRASFPKNEVVILPALLPFHPIEGVDELWRGVHHRSFKHWDVPAFLSRVFAKLDIAHENIRLLQFFHRGILD